MNYKVLCEWYRTSIGCGGSCYWICCCCWHTIVAVLLLFPLLLLLKLWPLLWFSASVIGYRSGSATIFRALHANVGQKDLLATAMAPLSVATIDQTSRSGTRVLYEWICSSSIPIVYWSIPRPSVAITALFAAEIHTQPTQCFPVATGQFNTIDACMRCRAHVPHVCGSLRLMRSDVVCCWFDRVLHGWMTVWGAAISSYFLDFM